MKPTAKQRPIERTSAALAGRDSAPRGAPASAKARQGGEGTPPAHQAGSPWWSHTQAPGTPWRPNQGASRRTEVPTPAAINRLPFSKPLPVAQRGQAVASTKAKVYAFPVRRGRG